MARWMLALIAAFLVVFCATVLLTGDAIYLVPAVILAAVVLGYALANQALTHRVARRHGSMAEALQDERDGIPSAHVIGDDETAVGDTTEAHDEITAHDLPKSHPGRRAAEARTEGHAGTTQGDPELLDVSPRRPDEQRPAGLRSDARS
jgi:hypothetical protein